jgi:hypothetical protein
LLSGEISSAIARSTILSITLEKLLKEEEEEEEDCVENFEESPKKRLATAVFGEIENDELTSHNRFIGSTRETENKIIKTKLFNKIINLQLDLLF